MILEKASKHHKYLVRVAKGLVGDVAEDMVQDLYLLLHDKEIKMQDVSYEDDINLFFLYTVLRNLCLAHLNREAKYRKVELYEIASEDEEDEETKALDIIHDKVANITSTWHNYNRRLFNLYMYNDYSIRDIAIGTHKDPRRTPFDYSINKDVAQRGLGVGVTSIWLTIQDCKKEIQDKLKEDFKNFKDGNYELIQR